MSVVYFLAVFYILNFFSHALIAIMIKV